MARVLSICTGMGLLDLAFMRSGFYVKAGCETDLQMQQMYYCLCGSLPAQDSLVHCTQHFTGTRWDGIIGGPPCQAHSKTRAMRKPKFPDLTKQVIDLLEATEWGWYLFENVCPMDIPGARHVRLDAMHFYRPHQSRPRWFTYSPNLTPPEPVYKGDVNALLAYPAVAARIYGPKRGAILQGYPAAAEIPVRCVTLQKGLANAVPYPLARAWAQKIKELNGPL